MCWFLRSLPHLATFHFSFSESGRVSVSCAQLRGVGESWYSNLLQSEAPMRPPTGVLSHSDLVSFALVSVATLATCLAKIDRRHKKCPPRTSGQAEGSYSSLSDFLRLFRRFPFRLLVFVCRVRRRFPRRRVFGSVGKNPSIEVAFHLEERSRLGSAPVIGKRYCPRAGEMEVARRPRAKGFLSRKLARSRPRLLPRSGAPQRPSRRDVWCPGIRSERAHGSPPGNGILVVPFSGDNSRNHTSSSPASWWGPGFLSASPQRSEETSAQKTPAPFV